MILVINLGLCSNAQWRIFWSPDIPNKLSEFPWFSNLSSILFCLRTSKGLSLGELITSYFDPFLLWFSYFFKRDLVWFQSYISYYQVLLVSKRFYRFYGNMDQKGAKTRFEAVSKHQKFDNIWRPSCEPKLEFSISLESLKIQDSYGTRIKAIH